MEPAQSAHPPRPVGHDVAQVHRKLAALRPTYQITVDGKTVAEVRKHLFSTFHDRFTIDIAGVGPMEMTGDLLSHEFTIQRDGQTSAIVSKRWISLTDTYAVDVTPGENDLLILATVLALDLAMDAQRHHSDPSSGRK
ncbi:MAG TPA: LURP-one-related family protein [Streptosporangiaceae bacterium]|nr:LURP-one-related family protein [Streptosporangiaceae bacterium]